MTTFAPALPVAVALLAWLCRRIPCHLGHHRWTPYTMDCAVCGTSAERYRRGR